MAKDVLHVVPHEQAWAVKREGNERVSSTHTTQKDAIEAARELAKERDDIVIHRADGTIRERVTYHDPAVHEVRPVADRTAPIEAEDVAGVGTRVRWEAVLAGAVVALAAFFALSLLALAIGTSVSDRMSDRTAGVAAAILSAAIMFASLFYGGYVASRVTAGERPYEGIIYGVLVWGTVLMFLGLGARLGLGIATAAVGPGTGAVVAPAPTPSAEAMKQKYGWNDQQTADYVAMQAEARGVDVNARAAAWWTFFGVVVSLLSAMAGGWFGTGAQLVLREVDNRRVVTAEPHPTTAQPRPA